MFMLKKENIAIIYFFTQVSDLDFEFEFIA